MIEPIPQSTAESPYDKIGPTAIMVAHRRTFTDIPYSQAIFKELEREKGVIPAELMTPKIAPQIEARYKLLSRLIQESGATQIFELAAGFSPRGLDMTDNPEVAYVESDLPSMSLQKEKIIDVLIPGGRPNLHLRTADATDAVTVQITTSLFDRAKPIAVVNEGLLRYLNFDEKAKVARNVHLLLERFGGVWITPDITFKKTLEAENAASNGQVTKIHTLTGINTDSNRFDSVDDARRFFENLGFTVESHSFMEVIDALVSPQRLGQSREEVEALLKDPVVFIMRLAS
jgi:O-methyltransferase involved in polyketide biosynthesis